MRIGSGRMMIEWAIEVLDPEHRKHYDIIEPVNEACRMGMNALKELSELKQKLESGALVEKISFIFKNRIEITMTNNIEL